MLSVVGDSSRIPWVKDGFRLIPSRFPPVSVYEGLVADDRIESLVEVENLTNPRLQSAQRLKAASLGIPEDSPRLQNWNHAPFAYSNPEGTRFFPPERPCLELSDSPQTALAVSVARRQAFMSQTNELAIGLDMRMLKTPVSAKLIDLRGYGTELSREERLSIGTQIPRDADGILFRTPERPSATCVGILKTELLGRTLQTIHYRFEWNGTRIARLYAFDDEGTVFTPETLAGTEDILAA